MQMDNAAQLCGQIVSPPVFSHESHGVRLYQCRIAVPRLSGVLDTVVLLVPEVMPAFTAQRMASA